MMYSEGMMMMYSEGMMMMSNNIYEIHVTI